MSLQPGVPRIVDLGRTRYAQAYQAQVQHVDAVLAARDAGAPEVGRILLVEHEPVITISRRQGARAHLLASSTELARLGVEVAETDRGGDITYHGPGQLVAYPILDLNVLNLGLHAYMRLLEQAVIDACGEWGVRGERDPAATGVWVQGGHGQRKIAAMGVRVRKWVSMHGLALNVDPDMSHFDLIVPCGLPGRGVTSLKHELTAGGRPLPSAEDVKLSVASHLARLVRNAASDAEAARASAVIGSRPRSGRGSS